MSAPRTGARVPPWLLTGLLALAILGLFGGALAVAVDRGTSSDSAQTGGTPSPAPATAPPSVSSTPAPVDRDLFMPPASFTWVPDQAAGTGPIDAATAAQLDGAGALSQTGLQQLGFVRGASRQWRAQSVVLVDLVYTFSGVEQAKAYLATTVAARLADPAFTVVASPAGAPAGAATFTNSTGSNNSAAMVFVSGSHAVVIGLATTGADPDRTLLATLASQQSAFSATS